MLKCKSKKYTIFNMDLINVFFTAVLTAYVSAEWIHAPQKRNVLMENILDVLQDHSLLSCKLKCKRNSRCGSIGTEQKLLLGDVATCYQLKTDETEASTEASAISLYVWNKVQLPPAIDVCGIVNKKRYGNCERNIAKGKLATVSRLYTNSPPSRLTDGIFNDTLSTECPENHAWFKIDLEKEAMIENIRVYQGASYYNHRIRNLKLEVIGSYNDKETCGYVTDSPTIDGGENGSYYNIICKTGMTKGQYVRGVVEHDGSCVYTTEVEVYGYFI